VGYSAERKESVLKKMLPPNGGSVSELSKEEGISEATLYLWRKGARAQGRLMPDSDSTAKGWNSRDKFAAVLETASLNEEELARYCRKRGVYPEQLRAWRKACEQANDWDREHSERHKVQSKAERKRFKALERELERKNKALAETAALLVLRKKAAAIWGEDEDG
jgi:transposase-like protein